jgi:hypothetical protein
VLSEPVNRARQRPGISTTLRREYEVCGEHISCIAANHLPKTARCRLTHERVSLEIRPGTEPAAHRSENGSAAKGYDALSIPIHHFHEGLNQHVVQKGRTARQK